MEGKPRNHIQNGKETPQRISPSPQQRQMSEVYRQFIDSMWKDISNELVESALTDEAKCNWLFDRVQKIVWHSLYYVKNPERRKEKQQEICMKLVKALIDHQFTRAEDFKRYMSSVGFTSRMDEGRTSGYKRFTAKSRPFDEETDSSMLDGRESPEMISIRVEAQELLDVIKEIRKEDSEGADLIVQRFVHGMLREELASLHECSEKTVDRKIKACLAKVWKKLGL